MKLFLFTHYHHHHHHPPHINRMMSTLGRPKTSNFKQSLHPSRWLTPEAVASYIYFFIKITTL